MSNCRVVICPSGSFWIWGGHSFPSRQPISSAIRFGEGIRSGACASFPQTVLRQPLPRKPRSSRSVGLAKPLLIECGASSAHGVLAYGRRGERRPGDDRPNATVMTDLLDVLPADALEVEINDIRAAAL